MNKATWEQRVKSALHNCEQELYDAWGYWYRGDEREANICLAHVSTHALHAKHLLNEKDRLVGEGQAEEQTA